MVFTSAVFLGVFLPSLLAIYFLANAKARPYVLLVYSLLFYAWGEPSAIVIMLALMVLNYLLSLGMASAGERKWLSAALLGIGVCADLGALVAYKYIGFIVSNLLLPGGSLIFVLFCTLRYGWGWDKFINEANAGEGLKMPNWLKNYMKYFVPAVLMVILVVGLVGFFK